MVTERTEDSFLHCEFMVVLPGKAGDVQTPPKFSNSPVSRGYKYHVHPVSKGQARTLSCFVVCFFSGCHPPGSYLSGIDIYSAVIKTCCFA